MASIAIGPFSHHTGDSSRPSVTSPERSSQTDCRAYPPTSRPSGHPPKPASGRWTAWPPSPPRPTTQTTSPSPAWTGPHSRHPAPSYSSAATPKGPDRRSSSSTSSNGSIPIPPCRSRPSCRREAPSLTNMPATDPSSSGMISHARRPTPTNAGPDSANASDPSTSSTATPTWRPPSIRNYWAPTCPS